MTSREIQIDVIEENFTWDVLSRYDLIFLHRPFRPDHLAALQVAKLQNIPVWVDYDDWLFDLPKWNGCAGTYANTQIKMIMAHILSCADVVSCSTQALYREFSKVNSNVVILPNADRPDLFPYRTEALTPRKDIFFWRGSNTHDGDLEAVATAFPHLEQTTYFLGSPLWRIIESMDQSRVKIMGEQDTFQYFRYIHDLKPKVMLFPLATHPFNHYKSNIAWMEAIHAGALCVAPDLPEWHHPGILNYQIQDPGSFLETAQQAMALAESDHQEQILMARAHINHEYSMNVVNQLRLEIVNSMTHSLFKRNNKDPFDELTQVWAFCQLTGKPMVNAGEETLREKNLSTPS